MKILIVSQHFYPDNFRVNEIAVRLYEKGNDVTVLTSLPDYASGKVPKDCKGFKNRKIMYKGVKVIRSFSVSRRSGLIFRILNYISFTFSSTLKAAFFKEKFDLVMCYQTSPVLMANAARKVAKKQKIPFLLYCLDLWPESLKAWGVGEGNPLFKYMRRYSKKIYNSADIVGITSKPFADYLGDVCEVEENKTLYLPQHSEAMNLSQKPFNEIRHLAFGGNIGSVQNIPVILRAISHIKHIDNFVFDLYGDGSELQNCKKLAKELQIEDKVVFHGRVSKEELWEAYENVDAFILTLNGDSAIGLTVPAKLQEYMSGGKPIIAAIGGAAAEIINESNCGVAVPANDDTALAKAIESFIGEPEAFSLYGKNALKYFNKHFTLEVFVDKLQNIFKDLKK